MTVTTTADSGAGSLRQAILNSNAAPPVAGTRNTIAFNIPGAGVHTIALTTPLPSITQPVVVDGFSQPAAAFGALLIELNGPSLSTTQVCLSVTGSNSVIRGLVVDRCNGTGISLSGSNHRVQGNFVGTTPSGTEVLGPQYVGVGASGSGHFIGTDGDAVEDALEGNLISGNEIGVRLNGTTDSRIAGNRIGTNAAGTAALPNTGTGVFVALGAAARNVIGTNGDGISDDLERNLISGNADGVTLQGNSTGLADNTIAGNFIGTAADGTTALPNTGDGVLLRASGVTGKLSRTIIRENVISANTTGGVRIHGLGSISATRVTRNRIFDNGGQGIDLDPTTTSRGVTLNDPDDADSGPNGLLNFPVLDSAIVVGTDLVVTGWTRPDTTVELFSAAPDPTGFGEGQTFIANRAEGTADDLDAAVSTYGPGPINGRVQGTDTTNRFHVVIPLPAGVVVGTQLTATAIDASGNTSEFSGLVPVQAETSDLAIVKGRPSRVTVGAALVYTTVVTNHGPHDARGVVVADPTPSGLTFVSNTGACTTPFPCALGAIPDGESRTLTTTFLVPSSYAGADPIANQATVSGLGADPDPLNNTANVTTALGGLFTRNVAVSVSGPASVTPGTPLVYLVTATNSGTLDATDVTVTDPTPSGLTFVGNAGDCVTAFPCALGTVPAGEARIITSTFAVPTGYLAPGPIVNTATVSTTIADQDSSDDTSGVSTTVVARPDLGVVTQATPALLFRPGDPLTYQLIVTNHGNVLVPGNGYAIADIFPADLAGAQWTCVAAPAGTCSVTGDALTTSGLPALAPGDEVSITMSTVMPLIVTQQLTNSASVRLTAPGLVDAEPDNDTATNRLFAAPLTSTSIGGLVTDSDGAPIGGVVVRLTGAIQLQVATDIDGTYTFAGLPIGHGYTVTPTAFGYLFSPAVHTVPLLVRDHRADFVGVVEPYRRYYSEGSTSDFFTTTYTVTNPGDIAATVVLRFQRPEGDEITHALPLAPRQHVALDVSTIPGLASTAFSTVIEADRQIISSRTMTWDRSGYGTHRGAGVGAPRIEWYIAEGATLPRFSLFYLLQNPGDSPATVTITYLLQASGSTPVVRTYVVAPRSRYTIGVHDDPALANEELAARIVTDGVPIVVERAMYLSGPRLFEAGDAAAAAPAPVPVWRFAEGATGPFFDLFLLLANPGAVSTTASVRYLLPDGGTIVKQHEVPAGARRTVWVDTDDPQLADTAVGVVVEATEPIVAERAMWWSGGDATWTGNHTSLGATNVAPRWGVSGLEAGGPAHADPWLLVLNPSETPTTIRLTLFFADGRPPVTAEYPVAAQSRFTIDVGTWHPETADAVFGAVIEQLGDPTGIVVESAVYSDSGGMRWAAGRGGTATPIP